MILLIVHLVRITSAYSIFSVSLCFGFHDDDYKSANNSMPRGSMTPARIVGVGVVRGRGNGLVKTAVGVYALEAALVTRDDSVFFFFFVYMLYLILWLVISTNMIN